MVNLLTIFGALALVSGGVTYFSLPVGLKIGLEEMINLKENGMVYPMYMAPPFPTTSTYYIYEIKNPREVLDGGKMDLTLRGPYKFTAYIKRANISFRENNERVSYDSMRRLYYDDKSSSNFDEKFYIINPIVPSILAQTKAIFDRIPFQRVAQPIVFNTLNVALDSYRERLIIKRSPRELLGGKRVALMDALTSLADRFGVSSLLPPGPPDNTFGLVHYQNVTADPIEVYVGVGATKKKFAEVSRFRGKESNTVWSGKCNSIEGTNGELYKPFPPKGKSIRVFFAQLCRSFELDSISDSIEIQDGLEAYEYEITPRLYLGARHNPGNKCYCKDTKTYDCQYDGFVSMGPCFLNAPVFFSRANFKGVDKRIRRMIKEESFENDSIPDKQSFYLDPLTGTMLRFNLTLVGAFKIVRQPYMRDLARVQNLTYAPLFSVTEDGIVPIEVTWQVKLLQMLVGNYKSATTISALCGSGILLARFVTRVRSRRIGQQTITS